MLIAALVWAVDWSAKAVAAQWLDPDAVIHNSARPQLLVLPLVCGLVMILLRLVSSRLIVIIAGIAVGGMFGNLVDRAVRGPVADFIPVPNIGPLSGHNFANTADVALLVSGGILLVIATRELWRSWRPGQAFELSTTLTEPGR
jgi:hypothetical protein